MIKLPVRVMLVGGDIPTWVGLSAALGERTSQIYVPKEIASTSLAEVDKDIDVIVVVASISDPDPCAPLRVIRASGMQRKTLVLADGDDQRTAAEALGIGIAGYLRRQATPEQVGAAVQQVAAGGVVFDQPASSVLHTRFDAPAGHVDSYMGAARALAAALELKDTYTGGHAERVTALAVKLARDAFIEDALPSEALEAGFLLHDVGKIGIPESILNKPSVLTDTERRVLNTHPILGERIVAPLGFPDVVRQVIRHHHERWDGGGYPDGLKGEDIPGAARIFAIADVIDAMTSIRPYRRPVSFEEAIEEVLRHAGTQFDPDLARMARRTFLETSEELLEAHTIIDI